LNAPDSGKKRLSGSSGTCVPKKEGVLVEERWEAGEIGCGQLVVELRLRLNRMKPGDRLEVIANDPGAPVDLPAWCRMTGHTLVSADHPVYVIRRKED
jgi:tRNA 2-thiouridine synthesizing protein A